jgi:glycosyltransferase involved in cell wall biosynthesis
MKAQETNSRQIELSVVMPAYNEEGAIEAAVNEVQQHVFNEIPASELVVVNDGSRDRTGEILDELASNDPRITVIHQANSGHGRALRAGMDAASGEYLFLIDSDRQIPLEAFAEMWKVGHGRDGVFGVRVNRQDAQVRLVLTRMVRRSLRLLFKVQLRDANVPFKLLKRSVWLEARELIPEDTLAPSIFLAIIGRRRYDIVDWEVPHQERRTGVVSIRKWKLFKFCARALLQLLAFRRKLELWTLREQS